MKSLISTLISTARGQPPRIVCSTSVWQNGMIELRRRAGGRRESGAFLLGEKKGNARYIEKFVYYDDIDPTCFKRGIVEFDGGKLGQVWQICRDNHFTVVADVHVHPGGYGQSASDQHNPVIPEAGHIAFIIPDYAKLPATSKKIGIYEYLGARRWKDHSRTNAFYIGWWPL